MYEDHYSFLIPYLADLVRLNDAQPEMEVDTKLSTSSSEENEKFTRHLCTLVPRFSRCSSWINPTTRYCVESESKQSDKK